MKTKGQPPSYSSTYRQLFVAMSCFSVIYVLSAHHLFFGEALVPFHKPIDEHSWTQVSRHQASKAPHSLGVSDTSWLVELAGIFEEEGDKQIAIAVYRKLAETVIPTDQELSEINRTSLSYFCLYRLSRCYLALNETNNAVDYAKKAFRVLPRKEPYYHLARYLDEHENDESTALYYYGLAAKAPEQLLDVPFGETNIYALDIEMDIQWPKAFPRTYLQDLQRYQDILDNTEASEVVHLHAHDVMILSIRPLFYAGYEELFRKEGPFRPNDENNEFYYSTPTIVRLHPDRPDDFLIVCRLINYRIDPVTREFHDYPESNILKSALALHRGIEDHEGILVTVSDKQLDKSTGSTMGPEDPKLLRVYRRQKQGRGELLLTMTSLEYPNIAGNGPRMTSGILHPKEGILEVKRAFRSPNNREVEKNWAAFQIPGDQEARVRFVYEWYPLTIGTLQDGTDQMIDLDTVIDTPRSFKYLRGSSNGVTYQQEIWFMVHGVGNIGYTYYHKFVVLDAQTLHVKKHSYPFKLEGLVIEFCLGLDIDEKSETMTIAYSGMDGSSVLRRVALWKVEALMVRPYTAVRVASFKEPIGSM